MIDLRHALFSLLLVTACEAGPTSDWPGDMTPTHDDEDDEDMPRPPAMDAGSTGRLDASLGRDSGLSGECTPSDAGVPDAGCQPRDF